MPEKLPPPRPEKLPPPQEEGPDAEFIKQLEASGIPVEQIPEDENKISPEDYDFLTDAGFDLGNRKEVQTEAGVMIVIPRNEGQSAFVKPENFRKWVSDLKDEQGLAEAKKDLEGVLGDNGEKKEKPLEDSEAGKEQLESLKNNFYDLTESVKRLYYELSERDGQNMDPLIDSSDVDKLLGSASNLESILDNIKTNEAYLEGAISSIRQAVEEIGNVGQRPGVNENEDSLGKVSFLLGNIEERCIDIVNAFGKIDKYDTAPLKVSINKLLESAQDRRFRVVRKLEAFRDYSNS